MEGISHLVFPLLSLLSGVVAPLGKFSEKNLCPRPGKREP
jgi:hypothetical protein